MPPPKGGVAVSAVLAKFRQDQAKNAAIVADAAKEREEKLKKVAGGGVKKTTSTTRSSRGRSKPALSSGPTGSDAPSTSAPLGGEGIPSSDWKTAAPQAILPLGMRQKQVVDFLKQREGAARSAEIASATGRYLEREPDLEAALEANPKIAKDADTNAYMYLPDSNVRDKSQLLEYVKRAGMPVTIQEIADAYKAVMDDVAALKTEGAVLGLHSFDPEIGCEVLYPVDVRLLGLEADPEVAAVWHASDVPDEDEEVAAQLKAIGQNPAPRKAPRKRAAAEKKRKKRRATKLRAVTNVHLMHLLEGEAPAAIDI